MKIVPHLIRADTIIDAWKQSAGILMTDGDRLNLVVHISDPSVIDNEQLRQYDPKRVHGSAMSVFDVANTIFPKPSARWNWDVDRFSAYYRRVYDRLKHRSSPGWGFYFQRLVSFGSSHANQLSGIVKGLSDWGRHHHGAFVLHVSSFETDRPRPLGAPCWQYAQFMADGDRLELLVAYRSHDYFLKALGNFVGLSRFLTFVCNKTGHTVGSLTCVSTYAYLNNHRPRTKRLLETAI